MFGDPTANLLPKNDLFLLFVCHFFQARTHHNFDLKGYCCIFEGEFYGALVNSKYIRNRSCGSEELQ